MKIFGLDKEVVFAILIVLLFVIVYLMYFLERSITKRLRNENKKLRNNKIVANQTAETSVIKENSTKKQVLAYREELFKTNSIEECEKLPTSEINGEQNYIFISYSHKDYKEVYSDIANLHFSGVKYWYDKGLTAGKTWTDEAEQRILDPRCSGVVFYLSENLFLSPSILREIKMVKDVKPFFTINLTAKQPSGILTSCMGQITSDGDVMDTIQLLSATFKDNITYLPYSSKSHDNDLIEEIKKQFNVCAEETSLKTPQYDDLFFTVFDYLLQNRTTEINELKDKFYFRDTHADEILQEYEKLDLIVINDQKTRIRRMINRSHWMLTLYQLFESRKCNSENIKDDYFKAYNKYLFNNLHRFYLEDILKFNEVKSLRYGNGIISNVHGDESTGTLVDLIFETGKEETFRLEDMIFSNDFSINYINKSNYKLIREYGAFLFSKNKEEIIAKYSNEVSQDGLESVLYETDVYEERKWEITYSDFLKSDKYRNIDYLREILRVDDQIEDFIDAPPEYMEHYCDFTRK